MSVFSLQREQESFSLLHAGPTSLYISDRQNRSTQKILGPKVRHSAADKDLVEFVDISFTKELLNDQDSLPLHYSYRARLTSLLSCGCIRTRIRRMRSTVGTLTSVERTIRHHKESICKSLARTRPRCR